MPYGKTYQPVEQWIDEDGVLHGDEDARNQNPVIDEPSRYAGQLLTRSALRSLPDPEPLIEGVLDQGTTALLYGKWGSGKSFIALDWAASVASGRRWQGRDTQRRKVLYVAAEGAFGLKGRIDAWETGWHVQLEDGDLDILPVPVNLTKWADVHDLAGLIREQRYGMVVLDTLARCMVGADENSAKDCGIVVDHLNTLREATPDGRGVVLGVHHTGKDGKTLRGSSAFEGGADTVYQTCLDGGAIDVTREKRKDGPCEDRHRLHISPVEGTPSAVVSVHRGWTTATERTGFCPSCPPTSGQPERPEPTCGRSPKRPESHTEHSPAASMTCSNPANLSTKAPRHASSSDFGTRNECPPCPPVVQVHGKCPVHPTPLGVDMRSWTGRCPVPNTPQEIRR
ncbi:AAA family ATPase [Rhodococcus pyridinivorans]|uniref:DnaB domain-containing protein helicase domain-containing protein n=1 Tax=Rhodococcus pyridinivorans AK37 TaxID=1114960 RepID=H0JQ34_9NOCA|nr:AAA family ATPase [Rhodococcus pyridinivorans]EHK84253.1 DnaB domain-containing protein helicase domain-containing protein [Rhodococcus pyridinivorans AK37]